AISVWCRQMGHHVRYTTFYGLGDPQANLPNDLDILFLSAPTYLAPLAYALAKIYRKRGVRTVIGGAHAKSFPHDCLRYFDLVVLQCDRALIAALLNDEFAPGSVVSSAKPYDEPPTVEERLPEIKASGFIRGRPHWGSSIPMLASVGCPYSCDFCTDWNVRYRALSTDRLEADLRFTGQHLPKTVLYFHDPNFGVRFDETMAIFERIPPPLRNRYLVESSLKLLNPERLKRLRDTNCLGMAPGIESWNGYSNKAGVGKATGSEKLARVLEQLHELRAYIPFLQANLILGLDVDSGDEPFDLTRDYLDRTPFVWPQIHMPMAFGGTPLFDTLLREERIHARMPFSFYRQPYLTVKLKNYATLDYLRRMDAILAQAASNRTLWRRWRMSRNPMIAAANYLSTLDLRNDVAELQATVNHLQRDPKMRAFHASESDELPAFYAHAYRKQLGKYAEWMPVAESAPILSNEPVTPVGGGTIQLV
ncbi:MAG TPA: hypothetical protein PKE45_21360, partial [Caldilineaceae bacterium]|nr:hypothetical protein [Caldilineaceae bacterium]